jgi:MscS family membrane protein
MGFAMRHARIRVTLRIALRSVACCLLIFVIFGARTAAQKLPERATSPEQLKQQEPEDALGRSTPRGALRGFLAAARRGDYVLARQFLNTRVKSEIAEDLARQLFVVLDARLPARLTQVSDEPEGSRTNPLEPDREVVGSISSRSGDVVVELERVSSAKTGAIWLFSGRALDAIPELYGEIDTARQQRGMLQLFERRVGNVRVFEAISVVLGLLLLYLAMVVLGRLLTPLAALFWRKVLRRGGHAPSDALPRPARLFAMSALAHWLSSIVPLSLLVREFLWNITSLSMIVSGTWLLVVLNGEIERHLLRRIPGVNAAAAISLLRVGRRIVDVLVIFGALLVTLRHFGVDPTPVLAGLGVGGLAVALAAQKTLENVIAGASLIFDQAVRVGDFLKIGDIEGTVDSIGLRSTRIRTLGRTIVSVPNSQIANMSLETLSARDKFWFHHVVGLRYETTTEQLHTVLDGIREMLAHHQTVDGSSIRVRFLRLGPFSLDVDVFAYVLALDWNQFLEIQERLLFDLTAVVAAARTAIAFPSQTMYVNGSTSLLSDATAVGDSR